jgi:hypothetical protein
MLRRIKDIWDNIKKLYKLSTVISGLEVSDKGDVLIEFESNAIITANKNLVINSFGISVINSERLHINPPSKQMIWNKIKSNEAIADKSIAIKNKMDGEYKQSLLLTQLTFKEQNVCEKDNCKEIWN